MCDCFDAIIWKLHLAIAIDSSDAIRRRQENAKVPGYTLSKKLARGTYGVVYACRRNDGQDDWAVKVMCVERPTCGDGDALNLVEGPSPDTREMIEREVRVMRKLNHPNIIKFRDVIEDPYFVSIVMDLFPGGDVVSGLEAHWAKNARPLTGDECRPETKQMVAPVAYLHGLNIMHRDLKADNFLCSRMPFVEEGCRIALTDFGTAIELKHSGQRLDDQCGSKEYWSPEFYRKDYSYKADVYALGVMIYSMVSGRFPFESKKHTLDMQRKPKVSALDQNLADFLGGALAKAEPSRSTPADLQSHPWLNEANESVEASSAYVDAIVEESNCASEFACHGEVNHSQVDTKAVLSRRDSGSGKDDSGSGKDSLSSTNIYHSVSAAGPRSNEAQASRAHRPIDSSRKISVSSVPRIRSVDLAERAVWTAAY